MDLSVTQDTLFPLPEPTAIVSPATPIERARQYFDACQQMGGLIPQSVLSDVLGVSRARVSELLGEGRFVTVMFLGKRFITGDSLTEFVRTERKAGRPFKNPSSLSLAKSCLQFGKELTQAK